MKNILIVFLTLHIIVMSPAVMSSGLGSCENVFSAASSAMENKMKGVSKETLIAALPPKIKEIEAEPLRSMREIAEEVYSYEFTDQLVYSVYKTEYCVRRQSGEPILESFSEAFPLIVACSKIKEKRKVECAMSAAGTKK